MSLFHRADHRLDMLLDRVADLLNQGRLIMSNLADIQLAVAAQTTVGQGVVALLHQLSASLKDAIAAEDPAAIQGVLDMLTSNTKALSDAVLANTPAAIGSATLDTPVPTPVTTTPQPDTTTEPPATDLAPGETINPVTGAPVTLQPGETVHPVTGEVLPPAPAAA